MWYSSAAEALMKASGEKPFHGIVLSETREDIPLDVSGEFLNFLDSFDKIPRMFLLPMYVKTRLPGDMRVSAELYFPFSFSMFFRKMEELFQMRKSEEAFLLENEKLAEPEVFWDNSYRFLVVEDNKVNQVVAKGMLRKIFPSSEIIMAANGKEALEILERDRGFDLIFMDCSMPVMDGFEASQAYREMEASAGGERRIPIIAMTAYAFAEDVKKCLDAGMDAHLAKPLRKDAVEKTLRDFLNNESSRDLQE